MLKFLEINQLEEPKPRTYVQIEPVVNDPESEVVNSYTVSSVPNLSDHVLVRGPAIQPEDIKIGWANSLGIRTSGVLGPYTKPPPPTQKKNL